MTLNEQYAAAGNRQKRPDARANVKSKTDIDGLDSLGVKASFPLVKAQPMNAENNIKAVRNLTRLALPNDDGYLFRLGVALYSFASLSSFMAEIASHLDPTINRTELQAKMGGDILSSFRKSVKTAKANVPAVGPIGQAVADLFEELNSKRSDIVHAYPITNPSDAQILHRRFDVKGKYFEVTNEFLNGFISQLTDLSDQLYEIRKIVRPNLGD